MSESTVKRLKAALLVIEKLGGSAENPEKLKMIEDMQDDIQKFQEDREAMAADIEILVKERALMLRDIEIFKEERATMLSDIKQMMEDINLRDADILQFIECRKVMESDIVQLVSDRKSMRESLKKLSEVRKSLLAKLNEAEPQGGLEIDNEPYSPYADGQVKRPKNDDYPWMSDNDQMQSREVESPAENMHGNTKETNSLKQSAAKRPQTTSFFTESYGKQAPASVQIKQYFESKVREFPALNAIREEVLSSKYLIQASQLVEAFIKEESPFFKLDESVEGNGPAFTKTFTKHSWLDGYL